jgi:hypothetical protein
MANDKTVEERIVDHYQGDSGDWVVARGKVTEAKFLKEAVARIKALKRGKLANWDLYIKASEKVNQVQVLRYKLEKDQKEFQQHVASTMRILQDNCSATQKRIEEANKVFDNP